MADKKTTARRKAAPAPSKAANDAMRKALTMKRPAEGWPWEKTKKKRGT